MNVIKLQFHEVKNEYHRWVAILAIAEKKTLQKILVLVGSKPIPPDTI